MNRTQFYASSRVPLVMWWPVRFGLFLAPMAAVVVQIRWLLEGMRCQTSPDYALYRYGNASKNFDLDYAGEGGFIYGLSSNMLFWQTDMESCMNVGMTNTGGIKPAGSLSLLWPLFLSLCMGAFTDTLSSALQGRVPRLDFNLLELSFAFNEAESMIVKLFEAALTGGDTDNSASFDRKLLIRATNTSPDMLLIALIWALSSLSSMVWGVFGKRHQYRLLDTGLWGVAYFAAISRSIYMMWKNIPDHELFWSGRIPLILLMGFIPHLLVVTGMITCASIYGLALLTTAMSLPESAGSPGTFREKLSLAYSNLQANVHFSNASPIALKMTDDFYTALLNIGFTILTAASEAVYLNEGAKVRVSTLTWLERKRIQELQQGLLFKRTRQAIPSELRASIDDSTEVGPGHAPSSGYGVERKIRGQERDVMLAVVKGSTGLQEIEPRYSTRALMATRLLLGTFWLVAGFNARIIIMSLEACGIAWRPTILVRLIGAPKEDEPSEHPLTHSRRRRSNDFLTFPDGEFARVGNRPDIDIEAEFNKHSIPGDDIDDRMYGWWKQGGHWGENDTSGEYAPSNYVQDDDTTSLISMSANSTTDGNEWEDEQESGRLTPTQRNPYPPSREATPFEYDGAFDSDQLARLLDPRTKDEQDEAKILSHRLRHPGIITRSRYARALTTERTTLLSSSRFYPSTKSISPAKEEAALEQFIIDRRQQVPETVNTDWATGASGMGDGGPQCVVCQDSPRTVLLWPCGCLCLCDDCRINMAARNFGQCVCCRTTTVAYSRLYVP